MSNDNTKPEFFALWSVRDLQKECARLNQVLAEVVEIAEKVDSDIKSKKEKDNEN